MQKPVLILLFAVFFLAADLVLTALVELRANSAPLP